MTPPESLRDARVQRLRSARQADSAAKRTKAIEVAQHLHRSGLKVTFARVAREAQVSTWLVYNAPDVHDAIRDLMAQQDPATAPAADATAPAAAPAPRAASVDSLRTDLALAREEVRLLNAENTKYRNRLRARLGAEAEAASSPDLLARVQELETVNAEQHRALAAQEAELDQLREQVADLTGELEGKAEALRRLMHVVNTP